jgi:hypothetical protein
MNRFANSLLTFNPDMGNPDMGRLALVVIAALALSGNAGADGVDTVLRSADPLDGAHIIGEDELDELRGGFSIAGLDMELGANVRTYFDGVQVAETVIRISPGSVTTTTTQLADLPGLTIVVGDDYNTLAGLVMGEADLSGLRGAGGAVLKDESGVTAALSRITPDQFLGVVVNTASGRDVRLELNLDVTIRNFTDFQQQVRNVLLSNRLADAVR